MESDDGETSGRQVTLDSEAGDQGRYASCRLALHALAAVSEHRRRTVTPHACITLKGLPDGWTLTQSKADHDVGVWVVRDPGGAMIGHIERVSGWRTTYWHAVIGDRENPSSQLRYLKGASGGYRSLKTKLAAAQALVERALIHQRPMAGMDATRRQGRIGGRPIVMDPDKLAAAQARRGRGESPTQIAKALGISRATYYRHIAPALEPDRPPAD